MADQGSLKDRLQAAATSSAARIAALDAAEGGSAEPAAKPPAAVEPKPVEKRGVGTPAHKSVNAARIALLKAKIKALAGKPELQAKLNAQIKAIQDAK